MSTIRRRQGAPRLFVPGLAPLSAAPSSRDAACAHLPDPRRAASIIYPLAAILALAVAALMAGWPP